MELVDIDEGAVYHPRELDLALPKVPDIPDRVPDRVHLEGIPAPRSLRAPSPQPGPYPNEFSRLSARAKNLILTGNVGAGGPYESRSEADFAVCLAMFSAGYDEDRIRAVLTNPANGISEKYREKGRHGESYLILTLRKARLHARGPCLQHRPGNGRSHHPD